MKRFTLLFLSMMMFVSCAHFQARAPQGFAAYEKEPPFQAVSSDGVVYRVHSERHKPEASLAFWKEALTLRMRDAGYRVVDSLELTVGGRPAWGLQLEAPLETDQSYLVVAIPAGKRLIVVEAAGEAPRFAIHREAILAAIREIRIP